MARHRRLVLLAILGTVVLGGAIAATCFWYFRLKPWFVFEKARYGNMRHIVVGVHDCVAHTKQMPKDLNDVVQGGYLPAHSPIYRCPLLHNSLQDESIPYTACEYEMRFEPNEVIVRLPSLVLEQFDLTGVPAYRFECRIDSSGDIILPAETQGRPDHP